MNTYGTAANPFPELPPAASFYSVSWGGTVVVVEYPEQFAYIASNDPHSPDFPAIQRFYDAGVEIPKADWKDHWYLEPINDPDGRYYTSRSVLVAPAGYEGYGELEILTGGFPDPIGDGAYLPYGHNELAAEFIGPDSAGDASSYYDAIAPELQPFYYILHREESGPDARIYNNGEWLRGITTPNVLGAGNDPDDPADSANGVYRIYVPDASTPYCALVNVKHASEVEVWQNTTNFQDGHSPAPTVKLTAYTWSRFTVDPATKRLMPYLSPGQTAPAPKWTRTINLAEYPPEREADASLGKFNARGFALPGDPLP